MWMLIALGRRLHHVLKSVVLQRIVSVVVKSELPIRDGSVINMFRLPCGALANYTREFGRAKIMIVHPSPH